MHLRYRFLLPLVAIWMVFAITPVLAAKPAPVPVTIPDGALSRALGNAAPPVCQLGQPGPAAGAYLWFYPSDDY